MKVANLLWSIGIGVLPVALLISIPGCTVRLLIGLTGLGLCAMTAVFVVPIVRRVLLHWPRGQIRTSAKELLRYSLPRVPGDFAMMALLGVGPVLAAHYAAMREVGYLSAGQSLLWLMTVSVTPLGIVLLPRISNLLAQGKEQVVRENLNDLLSATMHLSIFLVVQIVIFLDVAVRFWLGDEFVEGVPIMRVVVLALPFHLVYVAMRSPIDAAVVKAVNARNLIASLAVFLVAAVAALLCRRMISPALGLGIAVTAGFCVLGFLTCLSAKRVYDIGLSFKSLLPVIPLTSVLGVAAWALKSFLLPGVAGIIQLAVFELCLLAIYVFLLDRCQIEWPGKFLDKISVHRQEG